MIYILVFVAQMLVYKSIEKILYSQEEKTVCLSRQDSAGLFLECRKEWSTVFSKLEHPKTPSGNGLGIWTGDQWQRQL